MAEIPLTTLWSSLERIYSLPAGYLARLADAESGGNPNARNASGAAGLFQFMPGTASDYGLTNPFDPYRASVAAAQYSRDSFNVLADFLGRAPEDWELYLAHQQGRQGAINLLGNPSEFATALVGDQAVIQNSGYLGDTAQQFVGRIAEYFLGRGGDTFIGDVVSGTLGVPQDDTVNVELTDEQRASLEGYGTAIATGLGGFFERSIIVGLGFIFVAIGLSMFRTNAIAR